MKVPLKQDNNKIVDKDEELIAKVSVFENGEFIVNACNLDCKTKAMSQDMWRVINYFKNEKPTVNKDMEKSLRRIERYLNDNVTYE